MSGLGKFFVVVAILGSLASAGGGFYLATQKSGYVDQLEGVENALSAPGAPVPYSGDFKTNDQEPAASIGRINKVYKDTVEELNTANTSLEEAKTGLSESEAKVAQLTTKVSSTQKELDEKSAALGKLETEFKSSSDKLQAMLDELGGRELSVVLSESEQNIEKLTVLESEKKLIEEMLMSSNAKIEEFNRLDDLRDRSAAPLELSGKIVAMNKAWNFVVLDVGEQNQLVEGVDLTVYRGDALVGKVRTVSVDTETAIADILPEWTQAEIQIGDQVLF
ncbi:MAG: hypothetical protein AAF571_13020 [Verrucomicrobiota bacterium]